MSSVDEKLKASGEQPAGCCQGTIRDWCASAEKCAQKEPVKCAAYAFLTGLLMTILPVGRIIGALVRVALALLRPALIVLGAIKVLEEFDNRRQP